MASVKHARTEEREQSSFAFLPEDLIEQIYNILLSLQDGPSSLFFCAQTCRSFRRVAQPKFCDLCLQACGPNAEDWFSELFGIEKRGVLITPQWWKTAWLTKRSLTIPIRTDPTRQRTLQLFDTFFGDSFRASQILPAQSSYPLSSAASFLVRSAALRLASEFELALAEHMAFAIDERHQSSLPPLPPLALLEPYVGWSESGPDDSRCLPVARESESGIAVTLPNVYRQQCDISMPFERASDPSQAPKPTGATPATQLVPKDTASLVELPWQFFMARRRSLAFPVPCHLCRPTSSTQVHNRSDYIERARSLLMDLRCPHNEPIVHNLLCGFLSPHHLVRHMPPESLASSAVAAERAQLLKQQQHELDAIKAGQCNGAITEAYSCPACAGTKCRFANVRMPVRMFKVDSVTFLRCVACDHLFSVQNY